MSPAVQAFAWASRPLQFLSECAAAYGDCFTLRLPGMDPAVIFSHPEAVREIFRGDPQTLHAGRGNAILEPVLGASSLLCSDGSTHRRLRRMVAPVFGGARGAAQGEAIRRLIHRRSASWPDRSVVALQDELLNLTLDVILVAILGGESSREYRNIRSSCAALIHLASTSVAFQRDQASESGLWRRLEQDRSEYNLALQAEISGRRGGAPGSDFLSKLMQAKDIDGAPLSDSELREQVLTLALAGHETTATSLAWCLHALMQYDEPRDRLTAEIDALGDTPSIASIEAAPYLNAVCNEVLRWMPVIPVVSRLLTAPFGVGGRVYPAGAYLVPCAYLTHRREDLYPQAGRFAPERFLGRDFSPYEFLPFGGGARRCVGMSFAMFEMKIVLSALLRRFRFSGPIQAPARPVRRSVTVAPLGGVRVKVERRASF